MLINPYGPFPSENYKEQMVMQHLGLLMSPTQAEVDFIVGHIRKFPSLYQPLGDNFVDNESFPMLCQLFINNLSWFQIHEDSRPGKITFPGRYSQDASESGWDLPDIKIELRYNVLPRSIDGATRVSFNLNAIKTSGSTKTSWMAGFKAPVNQRLLSQQVRSIFSESLRDHSFLRVDITLTKMWVVVPVSNTAYNDYPPIYLLA